MISKTLKLFKKSIPLWAFFLVAVLSTSAILATVYLTRQIQNTCTINAKWDIKLLRGDTMEVINTIEWGSMDAGETRSTNQLYAGKCNCIKNYGNTLAYIAWQLDPSSSLPAGVTITAKYGDPPTNNWEQNRFDLVQIGAGETYFRVQFDLSTSESTPPGPSSFTINLLAADSSSG